MDVNEFSSQIRAAWDLVNHRLGIGRSIIWPRPLPVDEDFRRVILDDLSSYSEIYKAGLSQSHYNILLNDYSYFQFSLDGEASWRLAFMPNPWLAGVRTAQQELGRWEAAEEAGTLSHEDVSMLMDEMAYEARVPPIRFEYAPSQYKEIAHPAAHFHVGRHYENRWPSALKVGPKLFTMMIAKLYYSREWEPFSCFYGNHAPDPCIDDEYINVVSGCLAVHEFSQLERQQLHFGRNLVAAGGPAPAPVPAPRRPGRR